MATLVRCPDGNFNLPSSCLENKASLKKRHTVTGLESHSEFVALLAISRLRSKVAVYIPKDLLFKKATV